MINLRVARESWPIDGSFTISRGSKTSAEVVVVTIEENGLTGRGECVPYARYGESINSVIEQVKSIKKDNAAFDRTQLQDLLPAGAARNAVDCALWDFEAKQSDRRIWELAEIPVPNTVVTAYTLSLDTPDNMRNAASEHSARPLLKLKLAGQGDLERVAAVREGAPQSQIIVDANEGWTPADYDALVGKLMDYKISMIEQPFPASEDNALLSVDKPIKLCADESCHDVKTLGALEGKYNVVNIKLDKTGGLTEALKLKAQAQESGFEFMVGCMIATSLAMAPATMLVNDAVFVDLDGPLLLAKDRPDGLDYSDSLVAPPVPQLWG